MGILFQDVRYALRQLRKSPGFAAIAIVTLALGIGASTAIFSLVDSVLLRPLPYREPSRLVAIFEGLPKLGFDHVSFSAPDFLYLQQQAKSFSGIAAFQNEDFEVSGSAQPERIVGARVSASLFDVLGLKPAMGRAFTLDEDEKRIPVVMLSYGFWQQHFGGSPDVLGKTITLDRVPRTIVGVAPRGLSFPDKGEPYNNEPAALYVPISFSASEITGWGNMFNNSVIARLKPGVTPAQADGELASIAEQVMQLYPVSDRSDPQFSLTMGSTSYQSELTFSVQRRLLVLQFAVLLLLLIACVDTASLSLARATGRAREIALRAAVGASGARILRQLLTESLIVAGLGGALGVLLAYAGVQMMTHSELLNLPRSEELGIHPGVLLFSLALVAGSALITGLLPAIRATRVDLNDALREGGRTESSGKGRHRLLNGLVAVQFALALVLLVGSGLLVRSYIRMTTADPGFQPENVVTMRTTLPWQAYGKAPQIRQFYEQLIERTAALPGAEAVGIGTAVPLDVQDHEIYTVQGSNGMATESLTSHHVWTAGDYFGALRIPLRHGRYFTPADRQGSQMVVIVNETFAKRYFAGQDAIGQHIKHGSANSNAPWFTIVGVVSDIKEGSLNEAAEPQTFTPYLQEEDSSLTATGIDEMRSLVLVIRAKGARGAITNAARDVVHQLDASLPITDVKTMRDYVQESSSPQRFNTLLISSFGLVALLLAAGGIGGVLFYVVTQRTREIGVRIALGAGRRDVLLMVLKQGLALAVGGLVIGLAASLALTRLMASMLYGTTPYDAFAFCASAALLIGIALLASSIPAWQASRVDPMEALRQE